MSSSDMFEESFKSLSDFPDSLYNTNLYNNLNELLSLEDLQDKRDKWTTYSYNGLNVPRCTEIIGSTINKEHLKNWAAKLGDKYDSEMKRILDTGSLAHKYIEDYIQYGKIYETNKYKHADQIEAMKAYHNFIKFWTDMKNKGYIIEPLFLEYSFATPWYGGTIDFIAGITPPNSNQRKLYILDFKTSKKITYTYFLQLMLYAQAYTSCLVYEDINLLAYRQLNGIGIIRVDKQQDKYEYVLADFIEDEKFIDNLCTAASSMVNWFYHMNFIESEYYKFKKNYMKEGGIDGLYK